MLHSRKHDSIAGASKEEIPGINRTSHWERTFPLGLCRVRCVTLPTRGELRHWPNQRSRHWQGNCAQVDSFDAPKTPSSHLSRFRLDELPRTSGILLSNISPTRPKILNHPKKFPQTDSIQAFGMSATTATSATDPGSAPASAPGKGTGKAPGIFTFAVDGRPRANRTKNTKTRSGCVTCK